PTTAPGPTTTLSTPGGRPASFISSTNRMVESGVVLAGLATTVLPTASAGAILFASRVSGKFHGMIAPTTPRGRRTTSPKAPGTDCGVGRGDRLARLLDAGLWDGVHQLTGGGVVDLQGRSRLSRGCLAVDHHRAHRCVSILPVNQCSRN